MANYHDIRYNFAIGSGADIGVMKLLKTVTASSDSTINFVDGTDDVVLDSTYRTYIFKFINIHPVDDDARFLFQADTGTNTSYNITTTNASFRAFHTEIDDGASLDYQTGNDLAQSTSFIRISESIGADNDESLSGELTIFSPSSSVFVKHYFSRFPSVSAMVRDNYVGGYFNTTTALTRVQFKFSSGNIDSGSIKLYGIKDS